MSVRDLPSSEATLEQLRSDTRTLQADEARYRALFESMSQGVVFLDASGMTIFANPSARRILGQPLDQLQGRMFGDPRWLPVHEDGSDFPRAEQPGMTALRTGREVRSVVLGLTNPDDGLRRWLELDAVPLFRPGASAPFEVVATFEDITERTQTEDALRQSNELLSLFLRHSPIFAFIKEVTPSESRVLQASDNFQQMVGISGPDMVGKTMAELFPADMAAKMTADDWAVAATGKVLSLDEDFGGRNYSSIKFPIVRGDKTLLAGYTIDITDRKQAEDALRQSEQRLRAVLDATPFPVAIVDLQDDNILFWSRSALATFGHIAATTPEWYRIAYPDPAYRREVIDRWKPFLEVARHSREPVNTGEYQVTCSDGSARTCELYATFLSDNLIVTFNDITERKRAEQERTTLQDQLQQAQKIDSVGRLAGGVAHDFNNMLGVILGHTELALEHVDPAQPLHADLEEIRGAARRSAALTRQLLAYARKQTIAPRALDLNETVANMLTMLQRLIGEDIQLTWQPDAELWTVKMDPCQIDQILTNLCVNARDAIAGVGKLTIETSNRTFDEDYCATHAGYVPGDYVRLAVSDDGCGMDEDTLAHLFEPFFTTKGIGQGTGLGLATSYGIVKQNHGFINVYSEPGHGTTFTIHVPRLVGAVNPARTDGAAGPTARGHETILLVEDEQAILKLTTRMLKRQGYTVLPAHTPGEAIRLAKEYAGEIHLLMTDVVMPEMNGRDLSRALQPLHPHLARLFMSGYTANVIAHHGVLDEGVAFIQKPFSMANLAAKVREALDGEPGTPAR